MPEKAHAVNSRTALTEEQIRACTIGELKPSSLPVVIANYDPQWPELFRREAENPGCAQATGTAD